MTCWKGWRARGNSENFKFSVSSCVALPKSPRLNIPKSPASLPGDSSRKGSELSGGSGEVIFIRTCREEDRGGALSGRSSASQNNSTTFQPTKSRWIPRLLSHFRLTSGLGRKVGDSDIHLQSVFLGGDCSSATVPPRPEFKVPPKMEHSELVKELSHIEKLTNQERLKLAHNRRKLQLKYFNQYEKLLNNSSSISSGGNKKGLGKTTSQQQKMLEQLQQQEMLRKSKPKTKPNVRFCNSIMLLEAAGRNDIAEVCRLLQDGVDPDVANEDGLTALHQCCIDDNEEMMKLLIESGANVNSEDSEKWTPLHAASTCGHLHLVKHLIAKSANLLAVNAEGNMPYDICDEEATLDYIESEMAKRGVTQELIEDIRALPETKMLEDMRRLEREDGDLEERDRDGATYLHIAAANGYCRVVEFLLDHHVATDVQDKDCWQPVHAAACWSHVEVLELLVGAGADLNARTKNNETPYAICEDVEIKERIIQLRNEQETKMKESGVKKLRRSVSSNSRTQSIRRTSQRDKQNATKRDAADEAAMLLAIATTTKDSSPSPTGDTLEIGAADAGILPNNQASITSSEGENEVRSLPPWSQGRDSITELHAESLGALRKAHNIPNDNDSTSTDESPSPRLNNTSQRGKGLKNVNQGSDSKILRERNELNRCLQETGGTKFQNPLSLPVSNISLLTDTNANLPNPDINSQVDVTPKISNPTPPASTAPPGSNGVRICDSADGTVDVSAANSTIDIRVQVTINTNGSCSGSLNSLTQNGGTFPSSPRGNQMVQVTGPLFTPPGTLSDLKKQRSLQYVSVSRNSNTFPINGLKDFPVKYEPPPSPSISLKKFTGESVGMIGDESEGRRKCCSIV